MSSFLRYGIPIVILIIAIMVASFIPVCQPIQIVIAALLGGIPMWLLSNLLHIPNVIIEGLGQRVACDVFPTELLCSIEGILVNKSSTGAGELKDLVLRILLGGSDYLDIRPERSAPNIIGFRFQPNGVFPSRRLYFRHSPVPTNASDIAGKSAIIMLSIVGQKTKTYKTTVML